MAKYIVSYTGVPKLVNLKSGPDDWPIVALREAAIAKGFVTYGYPTQLQLSLKNLFNKKFLETWSYNGHIASTYF